MAEKKEMTKGKREPKAKENTNKPKPRSNKSRTKAKPKMNLKVIALGGLEEIGKRVFANLEVGGGGEKASSNNNVLV